MPRRSPPAPPRSVLIIGAGEFGSTTALALAEGPYRGHEDLITVIERGGENGFASDAASSDYNKVRYSFHSLSLNLNTEPSLPFSLVQIVRSEYSDPLYAKLAREAIHLWGTSERWKEFYHASGVIALSSKEDPQTGYVQKAYEFNKLELGEGVCECREDEGMKELYEEGHSTGSFKGDWGVSPFLPLYNRDPAVD